MRSIMRPVRRSLQYKAFTPFGTGEHDFVILCVEADGAAGNVTEVYRLLVWYHCTTPAKDALVCISEGGVSCRKLAGMIDSEDVLRKVTVDVSTLWGDDRGVVATRL
jgi:hypothetical protein